MNAVAIITLEVRGPDGQRQRLGAVVDTGFDSGLMLPPSIIRTLGLRWQGIETATLAEGSETDVNVFAGRVVWGGRERATLVVEGDADPLLGMGLIHNHDLFIRAVEGGRVEIRALA